MAPPPVLMDELVEECLLRLPPDDPAHLVRAALVCKGWRRIVTDTDSGFGRRFRELHGRPLVLGFLHMHTRYGSFFTPKSSFRPRDVNAYLRSASADGRHAIDFRHGRVLLSSTPSLFGTRRTARRSDLAVWDPVSGDQLDLPELPLPQLQHPDDWFCFNSKAAVLCASSGACDHLDCHRGHVVLMDATTYYEVDVVDVYIYSSQAGAWSHLTPCSAAHDHNSTHVLHRQQPVTMAGNVLYFSVHKRMTNGSTTWVSMKSAGWIYHPIALQPKLSNSAHDNGT
jgi:hypothetical protein